jgi:hypothetical protein
MWRKSDRKLESGPGGTASFGTVTIVLAIVLVAMMAIWHFANRRWIGPTFGVDVAYVVAPDTAAPGKASRFVVRVAQDNVDTPLAGRIMSVAVSPMSDAQIISISGGGGGNYAAQENIVKGRTDSTGHLDIVVRAEKPGQYTLVATDSASLKEATVDFHVSAPGTAAPGG